MEGTGKSTRSQSNSISLILIHRGVADDRTTVSATDKADNPRCVSSGKLHQRFAMTGISL